MRYHKISDLKQAAKTSDFLGFSVMTIRLNKALKFATICKRANPKIKIVFGGPHPSIFPEQVLKHKQVDFVVIGEGEETTFPFVFDRTSLTRSTNLSGITPQLTQMGAQNLSSLFGSICVSGL